MSPEQINKLAVILVKHDAIDAYASLLELITDVEQDCCNEIRESLLQSFEEEKCELEKQLKAKEFENKMIKHNKHEKSL